MHPLLILASGVVTPDEILAAFGPEPTNCETVPPRSTRRSGWFRRIRARFYRSHRIADVDAELFTLTADDIEHLRREESAPLHV